ncbi:MAG: translation initiation factor [Bacteroidota bacterium]
MAKLKKIDSLGGLVFSTNPNLLDVNEKEQEVDTLIPEKQKLVIKLDKKQRAGKVVTLITGFIGSESDLEHLCKQLKNYCGAGGSSKNSEILIQGDCKQKIADFLIKKKYGVKVQ